MRAWFAALLVVVASATVQANGRPPLTVGVDFRPGDPHSLYVASTFGLLISHDDGCTFRWVCESNIGYGGNYDPIYAVASDGSIFATTFTGLRVSRDGGCSFTTITDEVFVAGLDIGPTGEVWIATGDASTQNHISRSTDNGATFVPRDSFDPTTLWSGLKIAPSDAMRIYATGSMPGSPQAQSIFAITTDGGQTWSTSPLAGDIGQQTALRVQAVDPKTPDIVYVVADAANPPAGDLVYRSTDGGMTFTEVAATPDHVHDIAFPESEAGEQVIIATPGGSLRSADGGKSFSAMTGVPKLSCLGVASDGSMIGCGTNWDPDFMAVAKSGDTGASWQKVWRFVQIAGPLACPAGTVEHDACDVMLWPTLQQQFGATGPTCGSDVWPGDPAPPGPGGGGGCCDSGGSGPASLAMALVVLGCLWRRRAPR